MKITYSVQMESNNYNDDTFNGSYEECVRYANDIKSEWPDEDIQIAKIEVDANGTVTFTHDVIKDF